MVDRELVVSVISVRAESGSVVEGARGRPRRSRGRSRLGRRGRGLDSVDNDRLGEYFSEHKVSLVKVLTEKTWLLRMEYRGMDVRILYSLGGNGPILGRKYLQFCGLQERSVILVGLVSMDLW